MLNVPKGSPVAIKVEIRSSVTCKFFELKAELKPRMLIPVPKTPALTKSTPFCLAANSPTLKLVNCAISFAVMIFTVAGTSTTFCNFLLAETVTSSISLTLTVSATCALVKTTLKKDAKMTDFFIILLIFLIISTMISEVH